jgi:hypothetical protein
MTVVGAADDEPSVQPRWVWETEFEAAVKQPVEGKS